MFLDVLIKRNRALLETAIDLHQKGKIPASSFVIDIDAVKHNTVSFLSEARKYGLKVMPMTKQMGRNPVFIKTVEQAGVESFVAVESDEARSLHVQGCRIGHIGHLVQIPKMEIPEAVEWQPEYWTVFSVDQARTISMYAHSVGFKQNLLLRVFRNEDFFYIGHEGGFELNTVPEALEAINRLPNVEVVGVTSFPALLFNSESKKVEPTPNLRTLEMAAELLQYLGLSKVEVNAAGTTSTLTLEVLANSGVTQVEPGHGLTGTTPLHAYDYQTPELPAVCFVSEVSHLHGKYAYFYGRGLYVDYVTGPYPMRALVTSVSNFDATNSVAACILPPLGSIDYYGMLVRQNKRITVGDTVIMGFRCQVFVTRAFVVPVSGIMSGQPRVEGIYRSDGLGTVNFEVH